METATLFTKLDGRSIRKLHLLSGKWAEPVHCQLSIISLNDSPDYEALSYAWGDRRVTRNINVNGHVVPVTVNLEEALRQLRHTSTPRDLWVDALCINQLDITEKTHQVGMMADIYNRCTRVIIWLGMHSVVESSLFSNSLRHRLRKACWWGVHRTHSMLPHVRDNTKVTVQLKHWGTGPSF